MLVRSGEFGKEPPAEFRISNPKPIPVTVNFDRKPRFQGGNVNQADVDAFRVSPTTMTIGPHETGRVAVEFAPTELRTYNAKFTADVPGGQVISNGMNRSAGARFSHSRNLTGIRTKHCTVKFSLNVTTY